jgi:signal transduction histidine kinase
VSLLSTLSNRIFLASALLAVLSIGVAVSLVNFVVTRQAEAELERSLEEAGELVAQFQSVLFEHLAREARLIADLPKLKAAVATNHALTVQPLVTDYQQLIEADVFVVTDRTGTPLGAAGGQAVALDAHAQRDEVRDALAGRDSVVLWGGRDELLQVVTVPIVLEPDILGTLSAGVSLSRRLADRIKSLTRSDVVFFNQGRVQASTLGPGSNQALTPALTSAGVSHLTIGQQEYVAIKRPLSLGRAGGSSDVSGAAPANAPFALVLRSRTEHLAFMRTVHSALAITAVAAVLIATLLSYAVARTITRPLRALTATMREMASTGNLAAPTPAGTRWEDEDARVLTGTFETLTASLARFQREAAQRERLSSLGRLSTVLAHEIRNPLMIIKASLRTFRKRAQNEAVVSQAIADIEGEIVRLNRLVNEVLDYARPLTFTRETVNLDRLLADAVQAAQAGQPGPAVRLASTERIGEIFTDGDRLRQALVNVLSNAREACAARLRGEDGRSTLVTSDNGPEAGAPPMVVVRAERNRADGVSILVRDQGTGIAPEHLSRIFEPFFTTKQTGSGIGLAITRNIIEGLGGTIAVESEAARGTTVCISLPRGLATRRDSVAARQAVP